jgi:hypothetical protein
MANADEKMAKPREWSSSPPDGHRRGERPVGILLSEVEPEAIDWRWPLRIARRKITLLDGDPGLGKSVLAIDWASRMTRGLPWPDGAACSSAGVVILSAEDGLADTIRPRLDACGADVTRVVAVQSVGDDDHSPVIPADLPRVEAAIARVGAGLLIVDPLMAYLDGNTNSYRDQDVRRALRPLAELAERTGVAVVVIRHLNKAPGGPAMYRGGGSIGIIGAARIALLVGRDPEDEDRRVLAPLKVNIGPKPPALAYRLEEAPNGSVRVAWEGECSLTAEQLLAAPTDEEERGAIVEADEFLTDFLAAGPMATKTVIVEAGKAGIAERTLRRAAKRRGVRHRKLGMGGGWVWELPAEGGQAHGKMANPGEWPPSTDVGRLQATDKAWASETEDMGILI